jgi:hypothetical protein
MRKVFALLLILILTLSSSIMVKTSFASITKPSVPQFTVKIVDSSYDVPTTYSIDPYTGANVTNPSHRVENKTIELTIKNQPFVPYNESGWLISFYFNIRVKGHYAENWINLYAPAVVPLNPSNSDCTVVAFPLALSPTQPDQGYALESYDTTTDSYSSRLTGLPSNSQIDFQVEAMIGYVSRTVEFASWHFTGEESGWSNTQTVTIGVSEPTATPNTSPSSTPQDTTTPTEPSGPQTSVLFGLDWVQVAMLTLLAVVAVLLVVVIVFLHRRSVK